MIQTPAELIERRSQGPAQELRLAAPDLARQLTAGQAVLVRAGWGYDPYLRRAFHPVALDAESWTLRVPPSGDWGHAWLRSAPLGTRLDCLGPVGTGFRIDSAARSLLCVGQGEAAWALLPALADADRHGIAVALAMESLGPLDLIPAQRLPAAVEYRILSRSGRAGQTRLAVDLTGLLQWADALLAAGPLDFYGELAQAVQSARFQLSRGYAQVLYPATFLCGTGACQACAADLPTGRRRVCLRGPVFDLADVIA